MVFHGLPPCSHTQWHVLRSSIVDADGLRGRLWVSSCFEHDPLRFAHKESPMAKKAAGRRTQRIAKRQAAKESRDTKYANQKGGAISKKPSKLGKKGFAREGDSHLDDDGEDLAVVRGGKALWSRSTEPDPNAQPDAEAEDEDESEQRFKSAEKKLRALKKKLRKIEFIKQRKKKGFELEPNQITLLRSEGVLAAQIAVFEEEASLQARTGSAPAHELEDEDEGMGEDSRGGAISGRINVTGLSIEERRALKQQRHKEKLAAKARKREAKAAR